MRRFVLSALVLLGLYACGPRPDPALEATLRAPDRTTADFTELVAGAWDRLCVVPPYTTAADAVAAVGLSWRGFEQSGIASRDDVTLVVFAEGDRVLRSVLFTRQVDFAGAGVRCTPRASARFDVTRAPAEGGTVTLHPAAAAGARRGAVTVPPGSLCHFVALEYPFGAADREGETRHALKYRVAVGADSHEALVATVRTPDTKRQELATFLRANSPVACHGTLAAPPSPPGEAVTLDLAWPGWVAVDAR